MFFAKKLLKESFLYKAKPNNEYDADHRGGVAKNDS